MIKTFLLGVGTAFAVQYVTKKRIDGSSILSDFMDNPSDYIKKAKDYAVDETVKTVKEKIVSL